MYVDREEWVKVLLECVEFCKLEEGCWKGMMISMLAGCEGRERREKHDDQENCLESTKIQSWVCACAQEKFGRFAVKKVERPLVIMR